MSKAFNDEVTMTMMKVIQLCTNELLKEGSPDKRTTASALSYGRKEIAKDILDIIKNINLEVK